MTSPAGPTRPAERSSLDGVVPAEWPALAADLIVDNVAKVRDRTTKPAILAARALVFGLVAAIIASIALVLVLIGLVRLLDNYLPGGEVWQAYAVLFVVFTLPGAFLLRKAALTTARA